MKVTIKYFGDGQVDPTCKTEMKRVKPSSDTRPVGMMQTGK